MSITNQVEEILEKIKKEMRLVIARTYIKKNKKHTHYEYRICANKIGSLKISLMELYQKAFEQGVYMGKEK